MVAGLARSFVSPLRKSSLLALAGCITAMAVTLFGPLGTPSGAADRSPSVHSPPELERLVWPKPRPDHYRAQTADHRAAQLALLQHVIHAHDAAPPPALAQQAQRHGWEARALRHNDEVLVLVREIDGRRTGAGRYLFRPAASSGPWILQAPHSYFDRRTGSLALALFTAHHSQSHPPARALFVNDMHRYQHSDGSKAKRAFNPADVAHNPEHPFTAATEAFFSATGARTLIQLHGYSATGYPELAKTTRAIISQGTRAPSSATLRRAGTKLAEVLGGPVLRYPDETHRLGATKNVQGRLVRLRPNSAFLHVEMVAATREQLDASASMRGDLARVLADVAHSLVP